MEEISRRPSLTFRFSSSTTGMVSKASPARDRLKAQGSSKILREISNDFA